MRWTSAELAGYLKRGGRIASTSVADVALVFAAPSGTRAPGVRSHAKQSLGGRRSDLDDRYFRSCWEANYARYLNLCVSRGEIAGWVYEPKEFDFPGVTRGCMRYKPDFRVDSLDGSHAWHEVKGWMDAKSRTRLARMAKHFPEERVILIDVAWFKSAGKTLAGVIPGWESGQGTAS